MITIIINRWFAVAPKPISGGKCIMDVMQRVEKSGVVPVVVLEKTEYAIPTAKALAAGGVDVMEITLRTAAGLKCIELVSKECPEILVGAGTVITLEQCKACVAAGAKFIVSPGLNPEVVKWCVENKVAVLPGCVTPTEIMEGLALGVTTFKFFPADIYGGLKAMKALSAPFGGISFVPTGGVNGENLAEYASAPFIKAIGGSWLCAKADIAAGNFEKITTLAKEASGIIAAARH